MLALRRVRAHTALFAALLGVCLLLAGIGTALVGYLDAQSRQAVAHGIGQLRGADGELRYDAPKSDDPDAQSRRALTLIQHELDRAGGPGLPVTVTTADASDGDDFVWVLRPVVTRLQPGDLPALAVVGDRIEDALLNDAAVSVQGVEKSGALDSHARSLERAIAPLSAIEPVPLLLIAAIGVVTVAELGRLLDGVRMRETSLLRSRGASARRVGATTAAETALVAAVGAAAGIAAALGALAGLGSPMTQAAPVASVGLAVVVVAVVLVAGVAFQSARTAFRRDTADDSGRARRLAAPALLVLLTAAAVLALWRFLQFGSPLAPTKSGAQVDPIAVLAPALCLADVAVLGLALFPVVAGIAERIAAHGTGVRGALVSRQLARRVRLFASPVVLVALAGGGLVLAAAYQPTWSNAAIGTAQLHSGAELVADDLTGSALAEITAVPGVTAVAPVQSGVATLDDDSAVDITAISAPGLRRVGSTANGLVDPTVLARRIAPQLLGTALPRDTTDLTGLVSWTGHQPALTAQLVDDDGFAAAVDLSVSGPAAGARFTGAVPATGTHWTLVALDARMAAVTGEPVEYGPDGTPYVDGRIATVTAGISALGAVTAAGTTTALDTGAPWLASNIASGAQPGDAQSQGALGYTGALLWADLDLRLQPTGVQQIPVVISRAFARHTSLHRGDAQNLSLGITPGALSAQVAAIVDEVPGSAGDSGVLLDLAAVQVQRIRAGADALPATTAWVTATDAASTAARIRSAVGGAQLSGPGIDASTAVLASVPRALWAGMAGGAVLALIALAAVAGELLRLRAQEVAVLRAIGLAPRTVAGLRRLELVLVAAAALLVSAVGGLVASALTVPGLARAGTLDPFPDGEIPLRVDLIGLGAALLGILVALAVIVGVYGAGVGRQARTLTASEGAR